MFSQATSITTDGIYTYVSGRALSIATGDYEAQLWIQPVNAVPEPGTAGLFCLGGILLALQRRRKAA